MVERKNLDSPDETLTFAHGRTQWVVVGGMTVGRSVTEPGWRWSEHIKPIAGTEWCEATHVGFMVSGRLGIKTREGEEYELGPDDVYEIKPGHDGWVIGDEPVVSLEWSGLRGWIEPLEAQVERILATVLFTDIVDSTATALRLGDRRWQELLTRYNARTREVLARYRGREVKNTGDGVLALFDGAARALRCGSELINAARGDGLDIRVAVHTGEVELDGDDVRGASLHEASRILTLAGSGEVLVSSMARELGIAAGLRFDDRGEHELKGIDGARRVFALLA